MGDLISRAALFNACANLHDKGEIFAAIQDAPVVDAVPVRHGRWNGYTRTRYCGMGEDGEPIYRDGVVWYCGCCRRRTVIRERYCPNCGAKMDLEDRDERRLL